MIFLLSLSFAGTDKKQRARAEKETGWGKKVKEHNQLSVPRHAGAPQAAAVAVVCVRWAPGATTPAGVCAPLSPGPIKTIAIEGCC